MLGVGVILLLKPNYRVGVFPIENVIDLLFGEVKELGERVESSVFDCAFDAGAAEIKLGDGRVFKFLDIALVTHGAFRNLKRVRTLVWAIAGSFLESSRGRRCVSAVRIRRAALDEGEPRGRQSGALGRLPANTLRRPGMLKSYLFLQKKMLSPKTQNLLRNISAANDGSPLAGVYARRSCGFVEGDYFLFLVLSNAIVALGLIVLRRNRST